MSTMSVMEDSENTPSKSREEIKKFLEYCDSCLKEKKQIEKKGGVSIILYVAMIWFFFNFYYYY